MIAEFESRILALIDGMVDHASDDELFASGYLRGHLTLAIAELESGDDHSAQWCIQPLARVWKKPLAPVNCRRVTVRWLPICGKTCFSRRHSSK